mgnify:CR=1 FL=1
MPRPSWLGKAFQRGDDLVVRLHPAFGRAALAGDVQAKGRQFWELNNPSDVATIEAMMAAMG